MRIEPAGLPPETAGAAYPIIVKTRSGELLRVWQELHRACAAKNIEMDVVLWRALASLAAREEDTDGEETAGRGLGPAVHPPELKLVARARAAE